MKDYEPPYVPTWKFEVVPDLSPGVEASVPLAMLVDFLFWIDDWVDRILEKITAGSNE